MLGRRPSGSVHQPVGDAPLASENDSSCNDSLVSRINAIIPHPFRGAAQDEALPFPLSGNDDAQGAGDSGLAGSVVPDVFDEPAVRCVHVTSSSRLAPTTSSVSFKTEPTICLVPCNGTLAQPVCKVQRARPIGIDAASVAERRRSEQVFTDGELMVVTHGHALPDAEFSAFLRRCADERLRTLLALGRARQACTQRSTRGTSAQSSTPDGVVDDDNRTNPSAPQRLTVAELVSILRAVQELGDAEVAVQICELSMRARGASEPAEASSSRELAQPPMAEGWNDYADMWDDSLLESRQRASIAERASQAVRHTARAMAHFRARLGRLGTRQRPPRS